MYAVTFSRRARRRFEAADATLQRRRDRCFEQLRENPGGYPGMKALNGEYSGSFRVRVGDFRVIFDVDDTDHRVLILVIAHRSEAYT